MKTPTQRQIEARTRREIIRHCIRSLQQDKRILKRGLNIRGKKFSAREVKQHEDAIIVTAKRLLEAI